MIRLAAELLYGLSLCRLSTVADYNSLEKKWKSLINDTPLTIPLCLDWMDKMNSILLYVFFSFLLLLTIYFY